MSGQTPLGFGLIGCGKIAPKHADALNEVEGAYLAAVCDSVPGRAEEFGRKYGATPFQDIDEFLSQPKVQVVAICTPSGLHAPLAAKAAEAGKHLLVEKPLALTVADCQAVVHVAERAGVLLAVVHPNRFLPNVVALKRTLDSGAFGRISHASAVVRWFRPPEYYAGAAWRGTRAMDGGVLFNQAIHDIDLLQWMMGPVALVKGFCATRVRSIESEDVGTAAIRFASGAVGAIEACATVFPENLEETLAVFGERGTVVIGGRSVGQGVRAWKFADGPAAPETQPVAPHWGHLRIITDLVAAISSGRSPAVTGEEAIKSVAIVRAIYESDRTGREVSVEP